MFERILKVVLAPLTAISLIGVIVSGIWLAFLGEWIAIGIGFAAVITSSFLITIVLLPGSLFKYLAQVIQKKGFPWLGFLVETFSSLYFSLIVFLSAYFCFHYFLSISNDKSLIPLLIWSHGVATGVWGYLASKALTAKNNIVGITTFMHSFVLSAGYISCIIIYIHSDYSKNVLLPILALSSVIGFIFHVGISAYFLREDQKPWYERNSTF
ncbi:MAG: hypothetical protein R2817_14040 [Flavobacteriales bacterium]